MKVHLIGIENEIQHHTIRHRDCIPSKLYEYWNDVQQADQDLLDNIDKKIRQYHYQTQRKGYTRHKVKDQRRSGNETHD